MGIPRLAETGKGKGTNKLRFAMFAEAPRVHIDNPVPHPHLASESTERCTPCTNPQSSFEELYYVLRVQHPCDAGRSLPYLSCHLSPSTHTPLLLELAHQLLYTSLPKRSSVPFLLLLLFLQVQQLLVYPQSQQTPPQRARATTKTTQMPAPARTLTRIRRRL